MRIYDLVSQTSLQSFYHMALIRGLGRNPPTAAYVNNLTLTMIVAVDSSIAIMEGKDDDTSALPFATHNCRINAILYNPLFKQVSITRFTRCLFREFTIKSNQIKSINQSINQYLLVPIKRCASDKHCNKAGQARGNSTVTSACRGISPKTIFSRRRSGMQLKGSHCTVSCC